MTSSGYRSHSGTVRASGGDVIALRAISYMRVDAYGSLWLPGCLSAGFNQQLPVICWSHAWNDPIGRATKWNDGPTGPVLSARIDSSPDVPRGRQALAQIRSGTIRDCSIGFSDANRRAPTDAERQAYPGVREVMISAVVEEISLVIVGAVPGAKVAMAGDEIPRNGAPTIGRQVSAAEIATSGSRARAEIMADLRARRISQREAERRMRIEDDLDAALRKALRPEIVRSPRVSLEAQADAAISRVLGGRR